MKCIGTFIDHANGMKYARLLFESLCKNTELMKTGKFVVAVPAHLNLSVNDPGIEQIDFDLPEKYRPIPFVDKLFAAAAFERCCDDAFFWLDADSYFFKNTSLFDGSEIRVNPVDIQNIGIGYGEPLSPLWSVLYEYFGLEIDRVGSVTSTVLKQVIYPYYNACMICVSKPDGLFAETKSAIITLLKDERIQQQLTDPLHQIFFHQAVFSCIIMKKYDQKVKPLPRGVNYPLHLHNQKLDPIPFEELVSIRYGDYIEENDPPEIWADIFNGLK